MESSEHEQNMDPEVQYMESLGQSKCSKADVPLRETEHSRGNGRRG